MIDPHAISDRHLRQVWDDIPALKESAVYTSLLGKPTLREKCVTFLSHAKSAFSSPQLTNRIAIACIAVVSLIGFLSFWPDKPDFATNIAQTRQITLADGSIVTLGPKSTLDVDFSKAQRTVRLSGGEAFFSVAKNRARPFIVEVGDKQIRVVGTRFNVNANSDRVQIGVEEGIVEVMQPAPQSQRLLPSFEKRQPLQMVRLIAGQQVIAPQNDKLGAVQPLTGTSPGEWRTGRLNYQDARLADIIADAQRYYPHPIHITSDTLSRARLTTSFRTGQVEQMLRSLPQILPVTVRRDDSGMVIIRAADDNSK